MNQNKLNKIIEAEDELHYLQNILEYCDNEGVDLESAIQDRITSLYDKIEKYEK